VRRLTQLQSLAVQWNLGETGYLLRLLELLRSAGVQALPYKGPAWAQRLYGDISLRSWVDFDLLVPHAQVPLARDVLLASGFTEPHPHNQRILRQKSRGWREIAFTSAGGKVSLEVRWEVAVEFSARSIGADALFARAEPLRLLGKEVLTPSLVDLLLINCLHGSTHRWDCVESLLGLAVQVRDTAASEWSGIMSAARAVDCIRRVVVAVAHVCRVLGLQPPAEVADALARDRQAQAVLRSLGPKSLRSDSLAAQGSTLGAMFWSFASEDSLWAGLGHATARFFRPGPGDWAWIDLPRRLEWLYYPLRPVRLAIKWPQQSAGAGKGL
jgi:hypothetical protein